MRATPALLDDERADFQSISLSITPVIAEVGQAVAIGVEAANKGDIEGSQNVSLLVNGKLADSELIELAPGTRQAVSFVVTERHAGSYSVVVGGWIATFVVGDVVESFGVNWGVFGGIVGGVAAAAAVLVYLLWPRRREPRMTPGDDSGATSQDGLVGETTGRRRNAMSRWIRLVAAFEMVAGRLVPLGPSIGWDRR